MAVIKTPDQKVRVFISSTIQELADERKAAREAISKLRLTPVFFEAGARPHPPRDLYSAYLDQSHIFVGVYWNSYGWVAPGSDISGLEDEYRLCGKKPKLIYVKKSQERHERLNDLLSDIEKSDSACYQNFSTAEELGNLIENDLSVLMSETFETVLFEKENSNTFQAENKKIKKVELPLIKSQLVGRENDLNSLSQLISKADVSLINILGAGGTGKTTISIHLAHKIKELFDDGSVFVSLAPVTDSDLVATTIANVLELTDTGKQPIQTTLIDYLVDKKMLLVLDNFEQIVEASNVVSEIISKCPHVKIIVTSRTSLHVRGEHLFNLLPLTFPGEEKISDDEIKKFPAIELFIERARQVNQNLLLNKENTDAIVEICQRLDGLPLAIELAASRTKFFQPFVLLSRMGKTLDLVSKGHKDLPARQQTLRAAIDWSYNLLDDEAKKVFRMLGTFKRSWTLEAADAIINSGKENFIDVEGVTEKLLDVSLIKPVLVSHSSEPRFNMLQTVHEYAGEVLEKSAEFNEAKLQYANYFLRLCEESEGKLWVMNSEAWLDKLEYEFQNIRASFYIFIENKLLESAWKIFYLVYPYWAIRGGTSEAEQWLAAAKIDCTLEATDDDVKKIDPHVKGKTFLWASYHRMFLIQLKTAYDYIHRAEELLREVGDEANLGFALTMDGGYGVYLRYPDAEEKIKEAKMLGEKTGHAQTKLLFYTWTAEYYNQKGEKEIMEKHLNDAEELALQTDNKFGIAYIFLMKSGYMKMEKKFEEVAEWAMNLFKIFPEKGYKGFKCACLGEYFECMIRLNRIDEADRIMMPAMRLARESGEKEAEFHSVLICSLYFMKKNDKECGGKLFGSIENFIASTGYPLMGAILEKYELVKSTVVADENDVQIKKWVEDGKKINLPDALVMAMKK